MSHGLYRRDRDHLSRFDAAARHGYDPHRTTRIVDEAGAEEAYHPNGVLAWRRVLRRRTADVTPATTTSSGSTDEGFGVFESILFVQFFAVVLVAGVLIGDAWMGSGRGGAIGYLVATGVLTLLIWLGGKAS